MTAQALLDRLEGVKQTGPDRWMARCPAHDDTRPSLSVREIDDGTVLVKCWTGCGAAEIIQAVGLQFSDLFPKRTGKVVSLHSPQYRRPVRLGVSANDRLTIIDHEALVVCIIADQVARDMIVSDSDLDRQLKLSDV